MEVNTGLKILPKITDAIELQPKKDDTKFKNVFTEFIGSVNTEQMKAAEITGDFINGEDVELHDVMIAGEKAKTSLDLLMQIRNNAIDMYKELSRMQI
jgi:flagellar hook-basal body complex protein FliE